MPGTPFALPWIVARVIATDERSGVLVTLGLALAGTVVVGLHVHAVVPPVVLAAMVASMFGVWLFLVTHRDTWGWEGRYVDLWSIPHFGAGVVLWGAGLALPAVIAVAVAWELIEIAANVFEHPTNRVADVVLAAIGWLIAVAIA